MRGHEILILRPSPGRASSLDQTAKRRKTTDPAGRLLIRNCAIVWIRWRLNICRSWARRKKESPDSEKRSLVGSIRDAVRVAVSHSATQSGKVPVAPTNRCRFMARFAANILPKHYLDWSVG